jgi:hypothetical protein
LNENLVKSRTCGLKLREVIGVQLHLQLHIRGLAACACMHKPAGLNQYNGKARILCNLSKKNAKRACDESSKHD